MNKINLVSILMYLNEIKKNKKAITLLSLNRNYGASSIESDTKKSS